MKKILTVVCTFLAVGLVQAQQKQGIVTYERVVQLQIQISGDDEALQNMLPKTRKDNFELVFGNNQSVWKQAEKEMEDDGGGLNNSGMQIRMIGSGTDDILYNN